MTWRRFGRALLLRCPNCGQRAIFDRWVVLAEECPRCELHFEREAGYWTGAVAINTVATIVVFAIAFVATLLLTWPDVPWTAVTVVVVAVNVVFPIVFYPMSKTLWLAIDLAIHPIGAEQTTGDERTLNPR